MTQDWNDEAYYYDDYYDETPGRRWSSLALVLSGLLGVLIGFACAACVGGQIGSMPRSWETASWMNRAEAGQSPES